MKAEIMKRKPFIARIQRNYGEPNKPGLFVKFTDSRHKKWIGRFAKTEEEGLCRVIDNQHSSLCLVIANGKGYLLDIEKQTLLNEFNEGDPIISALHTTNPNYFVAGTGNSIFLIDQEGRLKEILPDFAVEGFNLKSQQENMVSGWLESSINQFENAIFFKVDLSNFNLTLNY